MQAIINSRMVTILTWTGFFDSMFLMMEEICSTNFKNLNIFREFFIEFRSFQLMLAPWLFPFRNASRTSGIYEYLLQL